MKTQSKRRKPDPNQKSLSSFVVTNPETKVSKVEKLIIRFLVNGMHSISVVEEDAFRCLITGSCHRLLYKVNSNRFFSYWSTHNDNYIHSIGLDSNANVPSRRTITRKLQIQLQEVMERIARNMNAAKFVCVTADAWTCQGKSKGYLGVTAHWV